MKSTGSDTPSCHLHGMRFSKWPHGGQTLKLYLTRIFGIRMIHLGLWILFIQNGSESAPGGSAPWKTTSSGYYFRGPTPLCTMEGLLPLYTSGIKNRTMETPFWSQTSMVWYAHSTHSNHSIFPEVKVLELPCCVSWSFYIWDFNGIYGDLMGF